GPIDLGPESAFCQFGVVGMIQPFAVWAKHSDEPLSQDAVQRGNEVIWLDAHVQKAAYYVDNIVCVDCRENEVTGQRRLDCDLGSFRVANFSHHDLVGVMSQYRS